ncbi:MAG TPA: TonB-dependent receptor [Chitinophagales bacterium]|jgi:hypothetical protein|nr:TonB-dependent receptor [Chitinophagales bacterium]
MKSFRLLIIVLLLSFFRIPTVYGEQQFILKGKITDQKTKENIPYVNIYDSTANVAITADSNGYFEITLPQATYDFEFSSIGYQTLEKKVTLIKDAMLLVQMQQDVQLQEVTVTSEKLSKTAEMNSSGITTLTSAAVERLPAFLGEKDIMKAILLTPGIQSGQEGARGIFVRGGSPDQNLILFHNAPIYNASHIYGFLSVFTMEAINKMDIYKSYIPVQYGGRLSSVINVTPNYGNTDTWKGDFSISVITSRFHIEGPLKKDRTSINFTIRDCHAGFFTAPIFSKQLEKHGIDGTLKYFFYDINGAIRHKVNDKNTLSWSLYTGSDIFTFADGKNNYRPTHFSSYTTHRKLNWLNVANTVEWETKLKKINISNSYAYSFYKLDSKQSLKNIYRDYSTLLSNINNTQYNTLSKISEHGWHTIFSQQIKEAHFFNYGIRFNGRTFTVNTLNANIKDSTNTLLQQDHISNPKVNTLDFYAFADYKLNWKNKIEVNAGVQLFTYYVNKKAFFYPQPRAEIIYHPIPGMSVRASVLRTVQPMHLLTNNTGDILNDVWVPATAKVEPETAWQYSGGIQYEHPKGYTASIDGYYKTMQHLTEYKYGTTFILNKIAWDDQLLNSGTGKAYGMELFFAKTKGQFTAWLKYNLGWSTRNYPELNDGKTFYYKYDRRNDISIVLQYKLKKHFDFSVAWTYGTGWRMTTPNSNYASDATLHNYDIANEPLTGSQNMNTYWNSRNNYVLPAYHHLDIGMNYTKQGKRVLHQLNVSVYNVYNRKNIFTVFRQTEEDKNGNSYKVFKQLSMFPAIPSIGYSIHFEVKKNKI